MIARSPDRVKRTGRPERRGSHEDGHAGEPDDDPDDGQSRQPLPEEDAPEDRHPDGHHRDEERGDARGDRLLSVGHHPHAAAQQERADDRAVAPLAPGRGHEGVAAARDGPGQQDEPRQDEADRRHEERGDGLDGDRDAEIRRTPDDVEDEEAQPDGPPIGPGRRTAWHRRLVQAPSIGPTVKRVPRHAATAAPESGRQTLHGRYPAVAADRSDRKGTRCASVMRRAWRHVGRQTTCVVSEP